MPMLPRQLTQVNAPSFTRTVAANACPSDTAWTYGEPKMTRVRAALHRLLLPVLLLAACAAPQPMPFGQVVARSQQGQSADQIVSAVRAAKTTYALRGADFGKLKQAGMADPVLDYLQVSFMNDVDLLTRYWVLGESVGGCARCVPQQVDLSNLTDPRQAPTSTSYYGYGPQGMPDWYRPYSATTKAISLDTIVQRAKQGVPEQELVAALRESRLDEPIIGGQSPTSGIRTHPVPSLTGSQLASLREQGVPDPVLDEIQTVFLGQFVELARLRYQNLGKGPAGPKP
jgi:hypothetical protein